MKLDLRKGFGEFETHNVFSFPDESIKIELKPFCTPSEVVTSLRSNDDIMVLMLLSDILERRGIKPKLCINYMMYQQDDRLFSKDESFGLRTVCRLLNQLNFSKIEVFHPHSDKIEFLDNVEIVDNTLFLHWFFHNTLSRNSTWVIPDSGAFKTQFKQIEKFRFPKFITCMKSRDLSTGDITTVVNSEDLAGADCFIVDDICLGGNTFINIAKELKKKNCGKLSLIVSHGVFNRGVDHILEHFDTIYTTDSIYTGNNEKVKVFEL